MYTQFQVRGQDMTTKWELPPPSCPLMVVATVVPHHIIEMNFRSQCKTVAIPGGRTVIIKSPGPTTSSSLCTKHPGFHTDDPFVTGNPGSVLSTVPLYLDYPRLELGRNNNARHHNSRFLDGNFGLGSRNKGCLHCGRHGHRGWDATLFMSAMKQGTLNQATLPIVFRRSNNRRFIKDNIVIVVVLRDDIEAGRHGNDGNSTRDETKYFFMWYSHDTGAALLQEAKLKLCWSSNTKFGENQNLCSLRYICSLVKCRNRVRFC